MHSSDTELGDRQQRIETRRKREIGREQAGPDEHEGRATGSRFSDVWQALESDPYERLPEQRVSYRSVGSWLKDAALLRAARRTLDTRADLLPRFRKLVHPLGICLRGVWRITRETQYSGYFASGKQALIIARASDAVGETRPNRLRFLGLAGKLYPTRDPDHPHPLETASFFVLENLAGSHTQRFAEATMTNDLWPVVPRAGATFLAPLAGLAGPLFALADHALDPRQPMIRQLYPIAELGEPDPASAVGPRYLKLVGDPANSTPLDSDLRRELAIEHHPQGIRFQIHVADASPRSLPKRWRQIGEIHFTDSVASESGDTRLHFAHPRYVRGRAERA